MPSSGLRRRSALPARRRAVAVLVAAPLLAAGCGLGSGTTSSGTPASGTRPPSVSPPTRAPGASVLQIVSHPDDDLFFMNPDTRRSLTSGRPLTSVYLTAGESDGVNAARTGPFAPAVRPASDKERYAEARQNGIRAAYAEMATGDRTSPWQRTAIPTAGGGSAEVDVLTARPAISLVWMQLREAGSVSGDRPHSLRGLWDGRTGLLRSQLASGSPVVRDFSYSREQVVDTLAGLLERYTPTHIRMLDPTPGLVAGGDHHADHQDHTYGARFAQAALARYAQAPGHRAFSVQNYLGYSTGGLPPTLDARAAAEKLHTVRTYAWMDRSNTCGDESAGCGDRKVAARPGGHGWTKTLRYTRGESTSWVQAGRDGRTWAFAVLDTRLAVWHRSPGGAWTGPRLLPGSGLDSGVSSVRLADGRIAVFATRTTVGPDAARYRRDVVTAEQDSPGGDFGPWRSLGAPEGGPADETLDFSAPAAAVDANGRITVHVRNARRSLSSLTRHTDGTWPTVWQERGGRDLAGDPVAVSDARRRQYVFAATPRSVTAWTRAAHGAAPSGPTATGLPVTTLALSAAPDGDGVRLWFRRPVTGEILATRFSGPVASPVTRLGGPAGLGPVSVSGPGNSVLAVRSATGVPEVSAPATGTGGAGRSAARPDRHPDGPLFVGAPSGGATGLGAVGQDGRLYWSGGGASGWRPVG